MQSEIHIVLIWEKGLSKLDSILYDLKDSFRILDVIEMTWSPEFFSNNLSRFYGEKLPDKSFKEKHCGKGPFVCIILEDSDPIYRERKTSKGRLLVNNSLFDKKNLYRNWTGGGHKVHTSNNIEEARHDIFFLFDKSIQEYEKIDFWSGEIRKINKNIRGYDGWKDFDNFFSFINESSNYLILRNYNNFESMDIENVDIDFLTSDKDFMHHINGTKKHNDKDRVAYTIKVGSKKYSADVRFLSDNYYDFKWGQHMLDSKIRYESFFIPDPVNEFYSLLYHSLIHKNELSDKYSDRLLSLSENIDLDIDRSLILDRGLLLDVLNNFLAEKQYSIVRPDDFSVQYNYGHKGLKRLIWEFVGKIRK